VRHPPQDPATIIMMIIMIMMVSVIAIVSLHMLFFFEAVGVGVPIQQHALVP
jgi:hypothetical protein